MKVLHTKRLKVSLLTELNDIFDCSPIIRAPSDSPEYTDETWRKYILALHDNHIGLVCLSKNYRSPLLWGHYSNSATGLAFGFENLQGGESIDVKYENSRPECIWPAANAMNPAASDWLQKRSFGVKGTDWAYEQEVRYIVFLDNCKIADGLYFVDFNPAELKEIIIGHRSKIDPEYLRRLLDQEFPGQQIKISVARPHPRIYEMELHDPVSVATPIKDAKRE